MRETLLGRTGTLRAQTVGGVSMKVQARSGAPDSSTEGSSSSAEQLGNVQCSSSIGLFSTPCDTSIESCISHRGNRLSKAGSERESGGCRGESPRTDPGPRAATYQRQAKGPIRILMRQGSALDESRSSESAT